MINGMLANDIDDRHLRPARIVQIGDPVAEAGAKMKERACWLPSHPCITICRSRYHAFKQTEHAAHPHHSVKCSNYMYFRGARIRKTGLNAFPHQRKAITSIRHARWPLVSMAEAVCFRGIEQ